MRNFRTSALAVATAATLAFGGTTAAIAEDTAPAAPAASETTDAPQNDGTQDPQNDGTQDQPTTDEKKDEKVNLVPGSEALQQSTAPVLGSLEMDKETTGQQLFGSSTGTTNAPRWAQALLGAGIVSAIVAALGLLAGPAYNFAVANGLIQK